MVDGHREYERLKIDDDGPCHQALGLRRLTLYENSVTNG